MKNYRSLLALLASAALVPTLGADTFIMTDGTKIEGEIVRDTVETYVIRAEISPGIRSEKTLKKIEVEKIIKTDPSLQPYEELKNTLPTPDLLKPEDYQRALDTRINPFLSKYPDSKFAPAVKEIKSVLESEMEQIKNGAVKLDGKLITPEERSLNQYEIDARLQYSQMRNFAKSRAFAPAMRKFEILESDYQSTIYFSKALELARQLIPVYEADLTKMIEQADDLVEKRRITLDRLDSGNRIRAQRRLEEEDENYQNALEEAKKSRSRWLPSNRFDKDQLEKNLQILEREAARIEKLDEPKNDAGKKYREILAHLDQNEIEEASEKLRDFKAGRPPRNYSETLEDKIKQLKETIKELEKEKRREEAEEARKAKEAARAAREKARKQ